MNKTDFIAGIILTIGVILLIINPNSNISLPFVIIGDLILLYNIAIDLIKRSKK